MSQRKFLVLFRSQPSLHAQPGPAEEPSPEQMQQMYATFNAWKEKYKKEILDMGAHLKPDGKVMRASGVSDGPFVEVKEVVGGFMVVGAKDANAAARIAGECPGVLMSPGASLEIREMATM